MTFLSLLGHVYVVVAVAVFVVSEFIGITEGFVEEWKQPEDPLSRGLANLSPFVRFTIFATLAALLWPIILPMLLAEWDSW